ncbi:MAG: Trk system potassium transporter TrkA [Candidatus Methanoperedens sp.]|nr:Trk system potassium transporter TrkA [Candidatus Methanoperedens sp.]MCZ7360982.1 Trk system potassium transporter TrkA [Candidatus Methanoperedens sp.]HLB71074.1 Trk system potassium transporter TrkA [Candidatus Methanoperedens sp.]
MRTIIVGAGEVGYHVAKTLCKNNDVTIIEKNEEACDRAKQLDVQVLHGNGADVKLLKKANIDKAELVVAVTGVDEVNIVTCMASKLLNNKVKTIARVSNPDYIDRPVSVRETVGMNAMICPELSLASEINQILSIPEAINVENFVGGKIKMMEFKVGEHNPLAGKKLSESDLPECCLMSAIFRGSELTIPHGDDVIQKNDRVVLVGKPEAIEATRKLFEEGKKNSNRIAVVGGGKVGYYLIKLLGKKSFKLTLLEINKKKSEELAQSLPNVLVINGDGTDLSIMKEENIGSMDAVIAVTNSDEKNLLCALLAKRLGAKKVIARADRPDYAELFEIVGVDVAISPIQATVNEVLKFTMGIGVESLVTIEGEKGRIIEITAKHKSKIINKKLKDVKFPRGAIVSAVVRGEEVIIPDGNTMILPEDKVVIFTLPAALSAVEELFS